MRWLVGAFVILLVAIVVAADQGRLPAFVTALYAVPGGDKVGHFVLMGILSFLVNVSLATHSRTHTSRRIVQGSLIVGLLATIEEVSQLLFETRSFSLNDLGSSYAGIAFFAYLASVALRRWKQK